MERVLLMLAGEINSEIGRTNSELSGWQLSLAEEVNLERAVEHWRQEESPFGLVGLGAELGRRSRRRIRGSGTRKLAPLKEASGGSLDEHAGGDPRRDGRRDPQRRRRRHRRGHQVEPRMVLNPSPPCIDMYPGDPSTDPRDSRRSARRSAAN
jgi:hypothetical protein